MLTILTTIDTNQKVQEIIAGVDRLNELITISRDATVTGDIKYLVVDGDYITVPLDWYDLVPPYLFPKTPFEKNNLLALIFYKLGNHQKAFEFLTEEHSLYLHLLTATHLQFGYEISESMLALSHQHSTHNLAIIHHYDLVQSLVNYKEVETYYKKALESSENNEVRVFTAKHFLNLLIDAGKIEMAKKIVMEYTAIAVSEEAKNAMNTHLAGIQMAQLKVPYNLQELDSLHKLQFQSITHFEAKGQNIQAGMILVDAAEVANFKGDFITSKELINRAIQYFKQENVPEFIGEAGFKKAILLYTWSKDGSPQYYKAAINAFQDVLKVFKRDSHPQKFADVHHNLALIYSEIPVDVAEKSMWTAFCASSFKEVLAFYTIDKYPYENAMVNHNYATALMHFPPAKIHDNLRKASDLFEEALKVRTAELYPFERALTLVNQLELGWLTHNENTTQEIRKYEDMKVKAEEIKTLVNDSKLLNQVNKHLEELEIVKTLL